MTLIVDEVMLREPNLLIPGKKPVGNVKIDWDHPLTKPAFSVIPMRSDGGLYTFDRKNNFSFTGNIEPSIGGIGAKFVQSSSDTAAIDYTFGFVNYPFTLEVLVSVNPNSTDQLLMGIVDASLGTRQWGLYVSTINDFRLVARNTTSRITSSGVTAVANTVYHVVGRFITNTSRKIYVNGGAETEGTDRADWSVEADRVCLGYWGDSSTSAWMDGTIYMANLYNSDISVEEIKSRAADPYQFLIPA